MNALHWEPSPRSSPTGDVAGNKPVDPYLVWALRGPAPDVGVRLPFLLELEVDTPPPEYLERVSPVSFHTRYRTGLIPFGNLSDLLGGVASGKVLRYQLVAPRVGYRPPHQYVRLPPGELATIHTLGVIDDGPCLAHQLYRRAAPPAKSTRFLYCWDQDADALSRVGTPWRAGEDPFAPRYGGELDHPVIERVLGKVTSEPAFYEAIHRTAWTRAGRSHGASVLHILTGAGGHTGLAPPSDAKRPSATAPIIFVQLPERTARDASGGSLGMFLLDGVHYIVQRTKEQIKPAGSWRTTICLSLGSIAGPHDGTSMLESALDELIEHFEPKVEVIVAAGNAAGRRIHAEADLATDRSAVFGVMAPSAQREDVFVEFWIPDELHDAVTFAIQPPGAAELTLARIGESWQLVDERATVVAAFIAGRRVAQGKQGTMALLAITATASGAPGGVWTVTMTHPGGVDPGRGTVHAWIERHEGIIDRRLGQRPHFVPAADSATTAARIVDTNTLSNISNGSKVTVVGGFVRSTRREAGDSSSGPVLGRESEHRPAWYAPSSESMWLRGVRVPGFFTGTTTRLSGTSAAAPRVARNRADDHPIQKGAWDIILRDGSVVKRGVG